MFLFVTRAFCFFIVRIRFFWRVVWVYLKSLNGSPACDCLTQTSWQVMQRDSDTADSDKLRIVSYCVERNMSISATVLPQV